MTTSLGQYLDEEWGFLRMMFDCVIVCEDMCEYLHFIEWTVWMFKEVACSFYMYHVIVAPPIGGVFSNCRITEGWYTYTCDLNIVATAQKFRWITMLFIKKHLFI